MKVIYHYVKKTIVRKSIITLNHIKNSSVSNNSSITITQYESEVINGL